MGDPNNRPKLKDEMARMGGEPLLPVEKKLVGWSLIIGAILLVVLVWMSYAFFPAAG